MSAKELLNRHKLRVTQNREEVLDLLLSSDVAVSNQKIENSLSHIDRITLYRTLKTFEDKGILHKIVDSTAKPKYALCEEGCTDHNHQDHHVHFECANCGDVTCLTDVKTPVLDLPKGYTIQEVNVIAKGLCDNCKTE